MLVPSLRSIAGGVAVLAIFSATASQAAPAATAAPTPPAAPAATPATPAQPAGGTSGASPAPTVGPLVPGVCFLSEESLIGRSKVGQAATARLRELAQEAQANLSAEKARLEARGKALEAKRSTLSPMQLQAQGQALNQRGQALQAEASEKSQQLDATKSRVFAQVIKAAQPYVTAAYASHGCGLLFARETVLSGNLGNDLTAEVIAAFDEKGAPIAFDLDPARGAK